MNAPPPNMCASEEEQVLEVKYLIREMCAAAARLGPCPTSAWLEEAARSASRALEQWDSSATH